MKNGGFRGSGSPVSGEIGRNALLETTQTGFRLSLGWKMLVYAAPRSPAAKEYGAIGRRE